MAEREIKDNKHKNWKIKTPNKCLDKRIAIVLTVLNVNIPGREHIGFIL